MTKHSFVGVYITCDEPGCTVQTGSICTDHGEKGEPLAHWEQSEDGLRHYCGFHLHGEDEPR